MWVYEVLHVSEEEAVVVLGQLKALDGQLVSLVTVLLTEEAEPQRDGACVGGGEGRGGEEREYKPFSTSPAVE